MFSFRTLFCVLIACGNSFGDIPKHFVEFNIFDSQRHLFESNIIDAVNSTKEFYSIPSTERYTENGTWAGDYGPITKQLSKLASILRDTINGNDGWKEIFKNFDQNERFLNTLQLMTSEVLVAEELLHHNITKIIKNIDLENKIDLEYVYIEKSYGTLSRIKDKIIGAPPFIELTLIKFIAGLIFKPIGSTYPCQMYDALLDWRLRAVDSRFDEISVELADNVTVRPYELLAKLKMKPYNPNGYINSSLLQCEIFCKPIEAGSKAFCVKDNFGSYVYFGLDYTNPECLENYAGLVRQRVEELFPVQLLDSLCKTSGETRTPTGKPISSIKI